MTPRPMWRPRRGKAELPYPTNNLKYMTRNEFNRAFTIAQSDQELPKYEGLFDGFGLHEFKPVHCTLRQVAELMRWQAKRLNGDWDNEALEEIANCGRRKFLIIGVDSDDMVALRSALT